MAALFLLLPETPGVGCKACSSNTPYIPLIGAGYFSLLIAVSLLFPSFPSPLFARSGLAWSVLLALALTYTHLPNWCALCLVTHACHILIWVLWAASPLPKSEPCPPNYKERLCLLLFAPFSVVALFSCLNLTFMAYGFKMDRPLTMANVQPGDALPAFSTQTIEGRPVTNEDAASLNGVVINFVSANCPYCEEQLKVLASVASQLSDSSYRFINVSSTLSPEWTHSSPSMEWVEDKEGVLRAQFKVSGYPTAFLAGPDGKILEVIPGVPDQLQVHVQQLYKNLSR